MVEGGLRDGAQAPPSSRADSPTGGQGSSRSAQERSAILPHLRRSQRLEGRSARQDIQSHEHSSPRPVSSLSAPSRRTDRAFESTIEGSESVAESALTNIPFSGTIIVSLDRRPPLEVRTGVSIPRLTVRVTITDSECSQFEDPDQSMDIGTLHAMVSLWSADGRVASPHAVPPMLTGRKDATLVNVVSTNISERQAEATFSDLAITHPGYYRIRISIMETPLPEGDEDGDVSVGSPRQLLSIETRPFHAHGFAPLA